MKTLHWRQFVFYLKNIVNPNNFLLSLPPSNIWVVVISHEIEILIKNSKFTVMWQTLFHFILIAVPNLN